MAITFINHKGQDIHYNDWRNLTKPKDFIKKIEEGNENTREAIEKDYTEILILTDITGSFVVGETLQYLKESGKLVQPITKKSATVGLSFAKKVLLNGINRFSGLDAKAFDTVEEAKEWLVSD